jgi:hypothetical protein
MRTEVAAPRAPDASETRPSEPITEEPNTPVPIVGLGALATPAALAPLWSKVIRSPGISPILKAILTNSSLVSLDSGKAIVVSTPKYATGAPKWITQITDLISREHGSKVEVALRAAAGGESISPRADDASIGSPSSADSSSNADFSTAPRSQQHASGTSQPMDNPLVKHALEVFGGRIVDVQQRRRS